MGLFLIIVAAIIAAPIVLGILGLIFANLGRIGGVLASVALLVWIGLVMAR